MDVHYLSKKTTQLMSQIRTTAKLFDSNGKWGRQKNLLEKLKEKRKRKKIRHASKTDNFLSKIRMTTKKQRSEKVFVNINFANKS